MKPSYEITTKILKLIARVSEKLGEVKALHVDKPSPMLRKRNKIKTIHSSLKIEGNTLTEYPVFEYLPFETLISENQREYYDALARSDKSGSSTIFIE